MLSKSDLKEAAWFNTCLEITGLGVLLYDLCQDEKLYKEFSHFRDAPDMSEYWNALDTTNAVGLVKTREDANIIIRAAFELGYIEQAMACQRILDGIPD